MHKRYCYPQSFHFSKCTSDRASTTVEFWSISPWTITTHSSRFETVIWSARLWRRGVCWAGVGGWVGVGREGEGIDRLDVWMRDRNEEIHNFSQAKRKAGRLWSEVNLFILIFKRRCVELVSKVILVLYSWRHYFKINLSACRCGYIWYWGCFL